MAKKKQRKLPAIPPSDYDGSMADWIICLVTRGLMSEHDFYGDVYVSEKVYNEILDECEG